MRKITNLLLTMVMALLILATACKKTENPTSGKVPIASTREELTKDSIYLYAQQVYLWNTGMPTREAFNPLKYTDNDAVIEAIKKLPSPGKPVDKYSFIDDGSVATVLSGTTAPSGDFGFSVFFNSANDLRIRFVHKGSPAFQKGLKRGDKVTAFNGRSDLNSGSQATIDALNAGLGGSSPIKMSIEKKDGSKSDVEISRGGFAIDPVMYSGVYTVGAKKVGYVVFDSFTTNGTESLDPVFADFAAKDVTEVVVDLRYNGGGSVTTAVDLTNLIAPAAENGKLMFTTFYNATMQSNSATILQNQKIWAEGNDGVRRLYSYYDFSYAPTKSAGNLQEFSKRGTANKITRAYFLVTGATASASELVINNLKPVMDVKVIGRTTYGKPVGFFSIRIDKYDLYLSQFQTKNKLGQGDYFDGIIPDVVVSDDVSKDFGDASERMLAHALNYAEKGNFTMSNARLRLMSKAPLSSDFKEDELAKSLSKNVFKGMIDDRSHFKLK